MIVYNKTPQYAMLIEQVTSVFLIHDGSCCNPTFVAQALTPTLRSICQQFIIKTTRTPLTVTCPVSQSPSPKVGS